MVVEPGAPLGIGVSLWGMNGVRLTCMVIWDQIVQPCKVSCSQSPAHAFATASCPLAYMSLYMCCIGNMTLLIISSLVTLGCSMLLLFADGFANEPASSQSQRPINPQLPVNPLLYAGQMPPRGASMTWQLAALLSHHRQQCQQAFYVSRLYTSCGLIASLIVRCLS